MTDRRKEPSGCCETICENLSAMHDGESLTIPSSELTRHLNECSACRTYQVNLPKLVNRMRKGVSAVCDADQLWSNVLSEIENEVVAGAVSGVTALAGEDMWSSKRIKQWLASVSLAASVIIGILTGAVLFTMPDDLQSAALVTEVIHDYNSFELEGSVFDVAEQQSVSSISWVASKVDFDLSAAIETPLGYEAAGVRLCSLSGKKMAFIQYTSNTEDTLSVYIMKAANTDLPGSGPRLTGHTSDGLTTLAWKQGEIGYVAISSLSVEKINSLLKLASLDTNAVISL